MFIIYRYNGRGTLLQVLESNSLAAGKMFALLNTKGKGRTVIINEATEEILYEVRGTGNDSYPIAVDYSKERVV